MSATHAITLAAAVLSAVVPASARGQAATVDEVLAVLASVVRDRAKQVATEALVAKIRSQICTHEPIRVNRFVPARAGVTRSTAAPVPNPSAAANAQGAPADGSASQPLQLWMGGKETCAKDLGTGTEASCQNDDVFVRSCRLVESGGAPLTDPFYLKSLSRDTIDFLLRVVSSNLTVEEYRARGLEPLGDFVHAALEQVTSKGAVVGSLASPTLTLASQLSAGLPTETLAKIGSDPATEALEAKVLPIAKAWFEEGCPYLPDPKAGGTPKLACKDKETKPWIVDAFPAGCADFIGTRDARTRMFRLEIFVPGTELGKASEDKCLASWPEKGRKLCERARLALNLHDALTALQCRTTFVDPTRRSTLRELIYVLLEQPAYRSALEDLAGDAPGGVKALEAFVVAARAVPIEHLPREEMAYGVRVLGAYLAAARQDPDGVARWMDVLASDLDRFGPRASADVLLAHHDLLHGPSLGSDSRPGSPAVADLREAVKDFLVLPQMVVASQLPIAKALWTTELALSSLVTQLREPGGERLHMALAAFAELANALSTLATELSAALPLPAPGTSPAPPGAADLARLSDALAEVSRALTLAADRDWVGLGIRAIEQVELRVDSRKEVEPVVNSFRFVRVLLSTYQAQSVEEAKSIFQAALEDTSSRTRRYDARAVDVGALLGIRGGYQLGQSIESGVTSYDHAGLYGLYAPFGVMSTRGACGWLFYPVDLGTYLTARPNAENETSVKWHDALRVGLARYRRWRDVPVALGLGADFRPPIEHRAEWRAFLTLSLELPMYVIY